MTETNLNEIIELTFEAREFKRSDYMKKIVFDLTKPFINSKPDKLINALEQGFMKLEGMTQ